MPISEPKMSDVTRKKKSENKGYCVQACSNNLLLATARADKRSGE